MATSDRYQRDRYPAQIQQDTNVLHIQFDHISGQQFISWHGHVIRYVVLTSFLWSSSWRRPNECTTSVPRTAWMHSYGWTVFRAACQMPREEAGLYFEEKCNQDRMSSLWWPIPTQQGGEGAFHHLSSVLFASGELITLHHNVSVFLL